MGRLLKNSRVIACIGFISNSSVVAYEGGIKLLGYGGNEYEIHNGQKGQGTDSHC